MSEEMIDKISSEMLQCQYDVIIPHVCILNQDDSGASKGKHRNLGRMGYCKKSVDWKMNVPNPMENNSLKKAL